MSDLDDTMPCDSFSRVLASTTSALPLAAAQDAADGYKVCGATDAWEIPED